MGGQQGRGRRQQRRGCQAQHPLAQGAVQQVHRLDQQLGRGPPSGAGRRGGGRTSYHRRPSGRQRSDGSGGMAQPRLKIQKQQRSAGNTQQGKQARPCGGRRQTEGAYSPPSRAAVRTQQSAACPSGVRMRRSRLPGSGGETSWTSPPFSPIEPPAAGKLSGNGVRRIFPWEAVFTEAESCDIMKKP